MNLDTLTAFFIMCGLILGFMFIFNLVLTWLDRRFYRKLAQDFMHHPDFTKNYVKAMNIFNKKDS